MFYVGGDGPQTQPKNYLLMAQTTTTAATTLTMDGLATVNPAPGTAGYNVLFVPLYSNLVFQASTSVRRPGVAGSSQAWLHAGVIARDVGGTARLVGSVTQVATFSDSTLGAVTFTANTAGQYLQVTVTPAAAVTLNWQCVLTVNEFVLSS